MAVDGSDMVWKVDIGTGNDHGNQTEENGICRARRVSHQPLATLGRSRGTEGNTLKMNFSVGVSIYTAKVTSY